METGRSQVCYGSFGSFRVGGKQKPDKDQNSTPWDSVFHVTMVNGVYSTAWLPGGKEGAGLCVCVCVCFLERGIIMRVA